ncbi:conserved hypothetical protein [Bradyrhizobium sp. STM 3843]|uniref:hypothetical protein n=1 Tax=Bradyrhizobium sp. STM 3843 TaxID=551947 RepID=UPI0002407C82|nr:hypothetical protein [Bradyrhizobium sp. STM 3843]CCE04901.1 conserved hypothetical protein [Bradyrhizobium sp. STM 3843]
MDDFDKMALVVDWLDACRNRKLDVLLDLYDPSASLECRCDRIVISGRAALSAYWQSKLTAAAPEAFVLEEISPFGERILLDCSDFETRRVRIAFTFDARGKIAHTDCRPAPT